MVVGLIDILTCQVNSIVSSQFGEQGSFFDGCECCQCRECEAQGELGEVSRGTAEDEALKKEIESTPRSQRLPSVHKLPHIILAARAFYMCTVASSVGGARLAC